VSLTELAAAASLITLLSALGARGVARTADRIAVEQVQGAILNAYRRTQSVARAWGRPAEVVISIDSIVIRIVSPLAANVLWRAPGPGGSGVTLSPLNHTTTFAANGMATGVANVTHLLQRGAVSRRVVVSRLGRVRVN